MTGIAWPHCVGQKRVKEALEAAVVSDSLGHAYLFSGMEGCGKFAAALDLALILLCEDKNIRPCMKCDSCTKVLHYAHPALQVIMPVAFPEKLKDNEEDLSKAEEWEYLSDRVKERITDAYVTPAYDKKPKIPVDWIREINHAIVRGPLEQKVNIVIFDALDVMHDSPANTLLKTLEEPPAGTVLLLLTDRPSVVLPTIVSRCQIMRFSWCLPDEIRAALCSRFSAAPDDTRLEAVVRTGSLGRSLYLWEHPDDNARKEADTLWDLCGRKNWNETAAAIDRLGENGDFSLYEQIFMEILQRVRNAYFRELGGTDNLFSGNQSCSAEDQPDVVSNEAASRIMELCERSISAVKAHANITLVLANFAIVLTETLNGEKQQPC